MFFKENFVFNENPAAIREPGIGLLIIFCFIQFAIANLILFLMEFKPFSKLNAKCCKKFVELTPQQVRISLKYLRKHSAIMDCF